jgi:hypothetical protein
MRKRKSTLIHKIDLITSETGAKVKVIRFAVSPKSPSPGDLMRIKFSVLNVSHSLLKLVPWRIVKNKTIIYSGYRFNLPKGSSFDVTATWEAVKGQHFFYTDVDPQNILHEPRSKQFNNFPQGIDVVV